MTKIPQEWFKQAAYDLKTAEIMLENKRFIYAVFMCHLTIEKALKGIYQHRLNDLPPKVHNLIYLVEKIDFESRYIYERQPPANGLECPENHCFRITGGWQI